VSASFAPWTTAAVRLTGAVDEALTSLASVSGSRRATTPQGGSILLLLGFAGYGLYARRANPSARSRI
jgi:hypothetical protein